MKGQYKIFSEVMLFAVGVAIASFVIISFSSVKDTISRNSVTDQLISVSDLMTSSLIKVSQEKSALRIKIPETISGKGYRIKIVDSQGGVCEREECFLNVSINGDSYTRQVFNISQNYKIIGDIPSTAAYVEIISIDDEIRIERAL